MGLLEFQDETETTMSTQQLPQTDSIRELAEFWDSHDLTDFEEELEEVVELVFERGGTVTLCLELRALEAVKRMADSQGVADVDLIRGWVLERISSS